MRLQTQLILSHLLVTLISVVIFVVGLLIGYAIYLQTSLPAAWTADWAEIYADEVEVALLENCLPCIDELIESEFLPVLDPAEDEWIVVTDADGIILASNNDAFPVDRSIWTSLPFGLTQADFQPDLTVYGNDQMRHFAVSAIPDERGWVYFHGGSIDTAFQLQQTVRLTLFASLGLGILAVIFSGVVGGWLAGYFGRRLSALGRVSREFATGRTDQRVPITGKDELNQLGEQFNQMADTISRQISDLRELAETNARLAAEAEGLARLEERNRLARELHDAVKQQLFGMSLALGALPTLIDKKPDLARQRLQGLTEQAQAVQVELDQIIKQLRPVSLEDQGLAKAVRQLTDQWSAQAEVDVELEILRERELPLQLEQGVYRIVQEALQNVAKHAGASRVQVRLDYDADRFSLVVQDDGVGFAMAQVDSSRSFGLDNMARRAQELGGTLRIDGDAGGTRLEADFPTGLGLKEWRNA